MTEPKVTANRRVVVVGASSTALACLEGLVFTPYLNLTSLTLVSPGGIPSATGTVAVVVSADATDSKAAEHRTSNDGPDGDRGGTGDTGEGVAAAAAAAAVLSPVDEDAPDAARMARMGLERHVRVVR